VYIDIPCCLLDVKTEWNCEKLKDEKESIDEHLKVLYSHLLSNSHNPVVFFALARQEFITEQRNKWQKDKDLKKYVRSNW